MKKLLLLALAVCSSTLANDLVIGFPNPNVYLSPFTWREVGDGSIDAPAGGAYIKGVMSGSAEILANIDTRGNSGVAASQMPSIKVTIDDALPTWATFQPGSNQVTLASGLSTGSHRFLLEMIGGSGKNNAWEGTAGHTHILSLQFSSGTRLSAPVVQPKLCYMIGDSYLQGYFGGVTVKGNGSNYSDIVDPTMSWPKMVAYAVGCEYGQVGYGGTGWLQAQNSTNGGAPAMPEWYDRFDASHAKSFTPQPDYVIEAIGINDHRTAWTAAQVQTAVSNWLVSARSTFPTAKIFLVIPPGGFPQDGQNRAPIVNALASVHYQEEYVVDTGTGLAGGLTFTGPSWIAPGDGIHPRPVYHGILAAIIAGQVLKATN